MNRIPAFDGLRAIAVIYVVGFHVNLPGFHAGFIGVDIFFVLSGFLITTIILHSIRDTGHFHFPRFLWNRVLRLYPALILMLLACALAFPLLFPDRSFGREWPYVVTYISNYSRILTSEPDVLRHTWSLSVEMQFYLLWPLLVVGLAKLSNPNAVRVLIILYLAITLWRMAAYGDIGPEWAYSATDTRMSGLMIGGVVAFATPFRAEKHGTRIEVIGLSLIAVSMLLARYYSSASASLFGPLTEIGTAIIVARLAARESLLNNILSHSLPVKLGQWSYGIYLWHYPLAFHLRDNLPAIQAFVVSLGVGTICAALSFELMERRIGRLRIRVPQPRAAPQ